MHVKEWRNHTTRVTMWSLSMFFFFLLFSCTHYIIIRDVFEVFFVKLIDLYNTGLYSCSNYLATAVEDLVCSSFYMKSPFCWTQGCWCGSTLICYFCYPLITDILYFKYVNTLLLTKIQQLFYPSLLIQTNHIRKNSPWPGLSKSVLVDIFVFILIYLEVSFGRASMLLGLLSLLFRDFKLLFAYIVPASLCTNDGFNCNKNRSKKVGKRALSQLQFGTGG